MTKTLQERIQRLLKELPPEHRRGVEQDIKSLRRAGGGTYEGLVSIVTNPEAAEDLRTAACWLLARLGQREAVPQLMQVLGDRSARIRMSCVQAIGELGDASAVAQLTEVVRSDPDPEVQKIATYALGQVGGAMARETLIGILADDGRSPGVRGMAAEQLGYLREREAVDQLLRALNDPAPEVRYWSVFALGQIGDRRVLPELTALSTDDAGIVPGFGSVWQEALEAVKSMTEAAEDHW